MKQSLILIVFSLGLLNYSCSSKDNKIVGSWRTVAYENRSNDSPIWTMTTDECRLDDVEEFKTDGEWVKYDGTNQCQFGDGIGISKAQYKIEANNTKIVFKYNGISGEYESTIELLTDNELILSWAAGTTDNFQTRVTFIRI